MNPTTHIALMLCARRLGTIIGPRPDMTPEHLVLSIAAIRGEELAAQGAAESMTETQADLLFAAFNEGASVAAVIAWT